MKERTELEKNRAKNCKSVMRKKYGTVTKACEALQINKGNTNWLLNGNIPFVDTMARRMEKRLELEMYALDKEYVEIFNEYANCIKCTVNGRNINLTTVYI